MSKVEVGTEFQTVVADGYEKFTVRNIVEGAQGDLIAECECTSPPYDLGGDTYPSDHAGVWDVFYVGEIAAKLRWQSSFSKVGA